MEQVEFVSILNEIKSEEHSFRDITKEIRNGHTLYSGPDIFKKEYDYILCFLIYLKYEGIVDFCSMHEEGDIEKYLLSSDHEKSGKVLAVWKKLIGKYPYCDRLLQLLNNYDFTPYVDDVHEKQLRNWGYDKLLKENNAGFDNLNIVAIYDIISNCQKHLGIDLENGEILLNIDDINIINRIMLNNPHNADYYLYNCLIPLMPVEINKSFFDYYDNIHLITEQSDRKFDGIITYKRRLEDSVSWQDYKEKLNDGGYCLALHQEMSNLPEEFYKYEIPILFETDKYNILFRKIEDRLGIIRYGWFFNDSSYFEDTQTVNSLTECIKNNINRDFYQILNKDDFRHTGKIHFNDVKRLPDQINFVWRKVDDIVKKSDSSLWLWDDSIPDEKIVEFSTLSKDPFKISISNDMYLTKKIYEADEDGHILEDCEISRLDDCYFKYVIPGKYVPIFNKCYNSNENKDDLCKRFDKVLCCRVLTHPCLLHSGGRCLRVKATPERPVCFRYYSFMFDENVMGIACVSEVNEIDIDPQYDENFIIYQLLNTKVLFPDYILVAPTKEEQHTYFLNKRLDYLAKYQPVVDEMENEVQTSISESPTYITGVGFKNFRRFSSLPLLSLSGVNIFVGGNNTGKSTLVKGLLLTLDNIKNLLIDNRENSLIGPKFQYDTNNYHDVHVGTFERAYSSSPIIDTDSPNRKSMTFSLSFAHFVVDLIVVPVSQEDTTSVPISRIIVTDRKRDVMFSFDFENMRTIAKFKIGNEDIDYNYSGIQYNLLKMGGNLIPALIRGIIPNDSTILQNREQVEKLRGKSGFLLEIADELERVINNTKIEYIYAHGVSQKVLFNYNDKNDYMAQTLHDLMLEKIGESEHEFICKWLKEFGLGEDYDVHSIGGEAYIIQLKMKEGKMVYLADMGMGSNQLVILILRLAIIIHKYRMKGNQPYKPTIIIEEPEQNMHPAFQSKLAILFKEVQTEYGFNFIVETHSEYLVRRSQVIVAKQKYTNEKELEEKCPFKVYYFPSEGRPYEMNYRTDGNFSNEFGNGFYDEANNLLFEII